MLLVAWLWRALWLGQPLFFASQAAAERGVHWGLDAGLGVLVGAVAIVLSRVIVGRSAAGERLARALAAALGPLAPRHCAVLAVASGIGEEALFRGALQPSLGLLGASLVFALAHFAPRRDLWPWSLFAFVAGLALGGLFDATGNLLAPMLAHALVNAVNLRHLVEEYGPQRRG